MIYLPQTGPLNIIAIESDIFAFLIEGYIILVLQARTSHISACGGSYAYTQTHVTVFAVV